MTPRKSLNVAAVFGFFLLGLGLVTVTFGTGALVYVGYYAGRSTCAEAISD